MSGYLRRAALQPWYHRPKPRCMARTWDDTEQCTFSAIYETQLDDGQNVFLCKLHKQMADFPMRPITEDKIDIRDL